MSNIKIEAAERFKNNRRSERGVKPSDKGICIQCKLPKTPVELKKLPKTKNKARLKICECEKIDEKLMQAVGKTIKGIARRLKGTRSLS